MGSQHGRRTGTAALSDHKSPLRVRCRNCGMPEGNRPAHRRRNCEAIPREAKARHPVVLSREEGLAREASSTRLPRTQHFDDSETSTPHAPGRSEAWFGWNAHLCKVRLQARILPDPARGGSPTVFHYCLRPPAIRFYKTSHGLG